ncbi:hypothetical protein NP233_g8525 [Leucocoprinus birnbaumii]|uniref:Uncharacterized protein n=1 Tax=Leucocoprinus birnbaumii TaxID=56174 RepID=A0AAD5VM54_9AGAR|nr:hypothetical protein NP233_g8525 [Leucocoprinus birnbaumii]
MMASTSKKIKTEHHDSILLPISSVAHTHIKAEEDTRTNSKKYTRIKRESDTCTTHLQAITGLKKTMSAPSISQGKTEVRAAVDTKFPPVQMGNCLLLSELYALSSFSSKEKHALKIANHLDLVVSGNATYNSLLNHTKELHGEVKAAWNAHDMLLQVLHNPPSTQENPTVVVATRTLTLASETANRPPKRKHNDGPKVEVEEIAVPSSDPLEYSEQEFPPLLATFIHIAVLPAYTQLLCNTHASFQDAIRHASQSRDSIDTTISASSTLEIEYSSSRPKHLTTLGIGSRMDFITKNSIHTLMIKPSAKNFNELMQSLEALNRLGSAPFENAKDLHDRIDNIPVGDVPWHCFSVSYAREVRTNSPPWMYKEYEVWFWDIRDVLEGQLANPSFDGHIDYAPKHVRNKDGKRVFTDLMSGEWAWEQANILAADPEMHRAMFAPVVLGSDKTTVSVATGQSKYYPLYASLGNLKGHIRQVHGSSVAVVGFLAIPKFPRSHEYTTYLGDFMAWNPLRLWNGWGIITDTMPFTAEFPRADIHKLLAPDLLHQVIKGTFKDHLIDWIAKYIVQSCDSAAEGRNKLAELNRQIASVPPFPGLRHFYEGRNGVQWTGDDLKGLMKIFLPVLTGLVPDEIVQAVAAFLEFCYIA